MQIDRFYHANEWVLHTYKIMNSLDQIMTNILDAESTTRGYVITGDNDLVKDLSEKIETINQNYTIINEITLNNPEQQLLLKNLHQKITDKIDLMQDIVALKRNNKMQTQEAQTILSDSYNTTTEIKLYMWQLYDNELDLLKTRQDYSAYSYKLSIYSILFVSFVTIIILLTVVILYNKLLLALELSNTKLNDTLNFANYRSKEMAIINKMNSLLASSASIKEVSDIAELYLQKIIPGTYGVIYILKPSANFLEPRIKWGEKNKAEKTFSPTQCWALRQGVMHVYDNAENNILCDHCTLEHESIPNICVPMMAQNEIIGIMHIEFDIDSYNKYNNESILLIIQNIARQIGFAIASIRIHDVLKTRSTRDPLTNLYNRSYLMETLERDLARAHRNDTSVAVVMLDLDHFKTVNDTYGHDLGDEVLKKVAQVLQSNIRQSDIVSRYGGEEFIIVLYDATEEDAFQRIDEMRKMINDLQFHAHGQNFNISGSFGISMYTKDNESAEELIKQADDAQYQSKKDGRNKVSIFKKFN